MASLLDFFTPGNQGGLLGDMRGPQPQPPFAYNWNPLGENSNTLLALAGGFLSGQPGAGFANASKVGLAEDEMAQKRRELMQTQGALYQAALQSGANPAQAVAFARSPEATLALTPKPIEAGQDLLGAKYFVSPSPFSGTLKPTQIQGGASGAPIGGQSLSQEALDKIIAARDAGTPREELLKMVPSSIRDTVLAALEGKAIPANFGRAGQARQALIIAAHAVDKNFNENQIEMRRAFARNMESTNQNSFGSQVRSSGTILEHLGDANRILGDLEKGPLAPSDTLNIVNPAKSFIRGQIGNEAIRNAQGEWGAVSKGLAGELERLLSGAHGAEGSKEYWLDKFNLEKHGPAFVRGSLNQAKNLMEGRLNNVALQKEQAYGEPTDPYGLLTAKQKQIAEQLKMGTVRGREGAQASPYSREAIEAELRKRKLLQQ